MQQLMFLKAELDHFDIKVECMYGCKTFHFRKTTILRYTIMSFASEVRAFRDQEARSSIDV